MTFIKYAHYLKDLFLVLLSSFFLIFSFPDFNLGFFAWVGLFPLLVAIHGKNMRDSFFLSFTCGVLFFAGIFYWIFEIPKFTLLHEALLGLYLGPYFGISGLTFSFITKRWGLTPALFSVPFIWVYLEYIRSKLSFLALPWGLLAHSQYKYPIIIQIASIAGTYSISFLIVMVNTALASLFLGQCKIPPHLPLQKGGEIVVPLQKEGENFDSFPKGGEKEDTGGFKISKREKALWVVTLSLIILTIFYGALTISKPITGNKIKVSLVQGNIEQKKKWDPKYAREIMQIYSELTEEAAKYKPTMIIWPETATPGSISINPRLHLELMNIIKKAETSFLVGSAQQQKFKGKGPAEFKYFNSAFLIYPLSGLAKKQKYDKIRLFPFGEYLPYKNIIPWSLLKVRESGNYLEGKEFTVFQTPDFRFGTIICWENLFPDLVRQFVKRGAQCIINLTNEAHFDKTAAPHQLLSMSVFRAVENRVYVVRCANTGVSCIIDPYGRIVDRVKDEKGQDIFIRGTLTGSIIPLNSKTIYTQYGDWLLWVAMVGSIIFIFVSFFKKKSKITLKL